jgi:hypothetical protein
LGDPIAIEPGFVVFSFVAKVHLETHFLLVIDRPLYSRRLLHMVHGNRHATFVPTQRATSLTTRPRALRQLHVKIEIGVIVGTPRTRRKRVVDWCNRLVGCQGQAARCKLDDGTTETIMMVFDSHTSWDGIETVPPAAANGGSSESSDFGD